MAEKLNDLTRELMDIRFGYDNLIALATVDGDIPHVRTVNSCYIDGSFYVITNAHSGKIAQLATNPKAAISGDWFTAQGFGENLGHVSGYPEIMDILRVAFAEWYDNGHVKEEDPATVLLRIRLTSGVLFHHGTRYDIDFTE